MRTPTTQGLLRFTRPHPVIRQNYTSSLMTIGDYALAGRLLRETANPDSRVEQLRADYGLQTGQLDLSEQAASALEALQQPSVAAVVRWQVQRQRGDWDAASRWLAAATDQDAVEPYAYWAQLEHEALMGDPEGRLRGLTARMAALEGKVAATAWSAIASVHQGRYEMALDPLRAAIDGYGGKKDHYLPFRLMVLSYLTHTCQRLPEAGCAADTIKQGQETIEEGRRLGWASIPFLRHATLFYAVAGDRPAALATLTESLKSSRWLEAELANDPHAKLIGDDTLNELLATLGRSAENGTTDQAAGASITTAGRDRGG